MEPWKALAVGCLLTSALLLAEVGLGGGSRDHVVAAGLAAAGPAVFGLLAFLERAARPPVGPAAPGLS